MITLELHCNSRKFLFSNHINASPVSINARKCIENRKEIQKILYTPACRSKTAPTGTYPPDCRPYPGPGSPGGAQVPKDRGRGKGRCPLPPRKRRAVWHPTQPAGRARKIPGPAGRAGRIRAGLPCPPGVRRQHMTTGTANSRPSCLPASLPAGHGPARARGPDSRPPPRAPMFLGVPRLPSGSGTAQQ